MGRSILTAVLTAVLCTAPAGAEGRAAGKFAGAWEFLVGEASGQAIVLRGRLELGEGTFDCAAATMVSGESEKGSFTVVEACEGFAKVDVKVKVLTRADPTRTYPEREVVCKEIWRLTDENTLQRCFSADPSSGRPGAFATRRGDGLVLLTFKKAAK
jgi:hypothetical protein